MTLEMRVDQVSSRAGVRPGGLVDIDADRRVVERIQAGDNDAFDLLYRQYFRRLRAYCELRVGDAHDAEEIAQEAFAKAFAALPTFAGERRFYPWVTVIASRLCIDHHRRQGRTEPKAEVDDGPVDGGQERVLVELDAALVRLALARLPERHRDILRLREEEGWSYNRIAEHYGVSLGAVESLLLRARRRLRQEFVTVSGGERGLAALPLLGALWRRLQAAARRLSTTPMPPELGLLGAQAALVAAVVAGALLPGLAATGPGPGFVVPDLASVGAAGPVDAGPVPGVVVAATAAGTGPAADARAAGRASPDQPALGALAVAGVVPGASAHSDAGARGQVGDRAEVLGEVWVGTNQADLQADVARRSSEAKDWLERRGDPACAVC